MAGRSDRRRFRRLVALLAAAGITPGLSACGAPDTISLSGQVDDRLVVVQAPDLIVPMPDPDAGFAAGTRTSSDSSASTNDATSAATAIGSITAIGSQHPISDVEVHLGQSVTVGQVLLRLDDATLRSGTAMAAADETVAARQVPVLDSAIDETYARQHDIEKALDKVADAIDQLTTTRARLQTQLSAATQQLPQLVAKRDQIAGQRVSLMARSNQVTGQLATLRAQLAQLPPQPPGSPPSPATAQLAAAIAQLEQARLRLRTGLGALRQADAQLQTGTRRLRTGIAKLRSAVPKLDNGLAQARSQQKKLHSARTKIIDARAELRRTRRLAVVAADAARVGVDVALNQVRLATITSPTVGTVVDVATVGQVVAPGAGLVTIREDADPTVTSWLAPDQLNRVCLGAAAAVSADWMSSGPVARVAPVEGTVTRIGQRADYPPTSFATDQVHLTRAVPVTITVPPSSGRALPPGVPVDLSIRPAAGGCFAPAATVPSSRVGLSDRQLPPERGHPSGQTIATNSR